MRKTIIAVSFAVASGFASANQYPITPAEAAPFDEMSELFDELYDVNPMGWDYQTGTEFCQSLSRYTYTTASNAFYFGLYNIMSGPNAIMSHAEYKEKVYERELSEVADDRKTQYLAEAVLLIAFTQSNVSRDSSDLDTYRSELMGRCIGF